MEGIMHNHQPAEDSKNALRASKIVQKHMPSHGVSSPAEVNKGRSNKRRRKSGAQRRLDKRNREQTSDSLPSRPRSSNAKKAVHELTGELNPKAGVESHEKAAKLSEQAVHRPKQRMEALKVGQRQRPSKSTGRRKKTETPSKHIEGNVSQASEVPLHKIADIFADKKARPRQPDLAHPKIHESEPFRDSTSNRLVGVTNEGHLNAIEFYRHVNKQHQAARAKNAMFTLSIADIHTHNEIVHANMRTKIPSADQAVINGFAHCDNAIDRLLKRTRAKDIQWSAQLQHQREEFEQIIAAEKAVSERLLLHSQRELVRWQERCERLEKGGPGSRYREGPQ